MVCTIRYKSKNLKISVSFFIKSSVEKIIPGRNMLNMNLAELIPIKF